MRWPWQRERSEAGHRTSVSEAAPPPAVQPLPVPPAGWAFLPPLQRTIGPMELAHGPERFAGSLAAWTNPSFTGAMSHLVTADAPPGVIDVDGGGTAAGEAYSSVPPEMTLLVPPARSRPGGGIKTAVQRTTVTADAPAGAAPAAPAAPALGEFVSEAEPRPAPPEGADAELVPGPGVDDGGKLAGERSVPPQPTAAVQRATAPTQVPPAQGVQVRGGDTKDPVLPLAITEAANPGADPASEDRIPEWETPASLNAGWDIVPPIRPSSTDSASDGSATYVSLPVPPAVQRAAEDRPTERTSVPAPLPTVYPSRLGLGRPLSFSPPESSDMPAPPVRFGQDAVLPVQRTLGPYEAAPVQRRMDPGDSAADPGTRPSAEATATPYAGQSDPGMFPQSRSSEPGVEGLDDGVAPGSGATTEADMVATSPVRAGEEDSRAGEDAGGENAGIDATGTLQPSRPAPPESSVQLISDALPLPSLSPSGERGLQALPLQRSHSDGAAVLPVTRLASHEQAQLNSQDGGSRGDSETAGPAKPEVAAGMVQPDDSFGYMPDGSGPAASLVGTGSISSSGPDEEAPVHSGRVLGEPETFGQPGDSNGMLSESGIPIQRFEYGKTELAELQAGTGLPPHGIPRALAGALQPLGAGATPAPGLPASGTVQRAVQATDTVTAGSALRASRPMASGLRAAVWQRMTAIPAVVQQPAASTVPLAPPALTVPGHPAGRREDATDGPGAYSATADGLDSELEPMPVASHRAADAGYQPRDNVPTDFGLSEVPPLGDLDEKPAPGAAVGSVIQQEQPLAVQPLQRTVNLNGAISARASHSSSLLHPRGTTGDGVVDSRTQDPVILTLAAPVPRPGGPGQVQDYSDNVQRLSLPEAAEAAVPPETGQVSAPPEFSAPSSSAEARSQAPTGSAAAAEDGTPPATERSTAAAPGPLGAGTPDQLEELAKRLAGPLIRRIKAEMLLDRERRGLRTDSN